MRLPKRQPSNPSLPSDGDHDDINDDFDGGHDDINDDFDGDHDDINDDFDGDHDDINDDFDDGIMMSSDGEPASHRTV